MWIVLIVMNKGTPKNHIINKIISEKTIVRIEHQQQKVKQGSNRCCYANRHITTAAIILYG